MNSIFINYDPFGMESQVLITKEGKTVGNTYYRSELSKLAEFVVKSAHEHDIQSVHVRAPAVLYDELNNLVQAQEHVLYSMNQIKMERIQ